jgi:hypothetical protein
MALAPLDPLGMASAPLPATSKLPPVHAASASRNRVGVEDFTGETSAGAVRLSASSRRKGGLKAPKSNDPNDGEPQAAEGHRRCIQQHALQCIIITSLITNINRFHSFRKSKSSRLPPPPPTDSLEDSEMVGGAAALPPPMHSVILDTEPVDRPRRSRRSEGPAVERVDRVAIEASFDGIKSVGGGGVDGANDVRTGYSSSAAQVAAEPTITMRWSALSAQAARVHDCEYIARQLPLHFAIHVAHHSSTDSCTQRLLLAAGAYTWHILASTVRNSLQLQHSLLQVHQFIALQPWFPDVESGALVSSTAYRRAPTPRRHDRCT